MGDKIKDIVLNKITDEILNVVVGLSKQELDNLINQNKLQKILQHCISKFAKSEVFKTEFRSTIYYEDTESILAISDEDINASLPKQSIKINTLEILKKCFISDTGDQISRIADIIIEQYVQQAKTTLQVYDIIKNQQESFYNIDKSIVGLKEFLIESKEKEIQLNIEKQTLLRKELYNELSSVITEIMNNYLYLLCKKAPDLNGVDPQDASSLIRSMTKKIEYIIAHIDEYVKQDFCTIPVNVLQVNGLSTQYQEISYFQFIEFVFKNTNLSYTDTLLKYKDLLDTETYVLVLKLRNGLNNNIFPSLYAKGQTSIINCKNIKIDVGDFCKVLVEIGECIIKIKEKILS